MYVLWPVKGLRTERRTRRTGSGRNPRVGRRDIDVHDTPGLGLPGITSPLRDVTGPELVPRYPNRVTRFKPVLIDLIAERDEPAHLVTGRLKDHIKAESWET